MATEISNERIKPCPVCGSEVVYVGASKGVVFHHAWCKQCNRRGPSKDTEQEAIESWNEGFDNNYSKKGMSQGEMAVWAVAFERGYSERMDMRNPDTVSEQIDYAVTACEDAGEAVETLRKSLLEVIEGYGEDSYVTKYLREILNRPEGKK